MPVSKTRKKPKSPQPERTAPANLGAALFAVYEATTHLVREAELELRNAARAGDEDAVNKALEVHHYIRTGALGLLTGYSVLTDMPDPRESEVLKR